MMICIQQTVVSSRPIHSHMGLWKCGGLRESCAVSCVYPRGRNISLVTNGADYIFFVGPCILLCFGLLFFGYSSLASYTM